MTERPSAVTTDAAADDAAIAVQLERRRRAAAERWQLDDQVVLVAAGDRLPVPGRGDRTYPFRAHSEYLYLTDRERPGGVLAFDPQEGWVDFVVPVTRDERLWEGATADQPEGVPVADLAAWLEQRKGRPVACLGAAMPDVASEAQLEADLRYGLNHVRRQKDAVELARMRAAERATQCKLFMGRQGRPADDCLLHPIIAPGSDMPKITQNTLIGLGDNFQWALLHYEDPVPKAQTVNRDWYAGIPPCVGYSGTGQQCDEFPYFSTLEGGPPAAGGIQPALMLVPGVEQSRQGGHLSSFNSACGLNTRPNNPPFWVIPMYWNGPKTVKLCNGWGPAVVP